MLDANGKAWQQGGLQMGPLWEEEARGCPVPDIAVPARTYSGPQLSPSARLLVKKSEQGQKTRRGGKNRENSKVRELEDALWQSRYIPERTETMDKLMMEPVLL